MSSIWWKSLQKSSMNEMFKFFLWKLSNRGLPVKVNLIKKNIEVDYQHCPFGCDQMEDEAHLFFFCHLARSLWFASQWCIRWDQLGLNSLLIILCDPCPYLPVHEEDKQGQML